MSTDVIRIYNLQNSVTPTPDILYLESFDAIGSGRNCRLILLQAILSNIHSLPSQSFCECHAELGDIVRTAEVRVGKC